MTAKRLKHSITDATICKDNNSNNRVKRIKINMKKKTFVFTGSKWDWLCDFFYFRYIYLILKDKAEQI